MQTKLTLRLDEGLIRQAKDYARNSGKSVSEIVADFFANLTEGPADERAEPLPSAVAALVGVIGKAKLDEDDYREYIEKKHA